MARSRAQLEEEIERQKQTIQEQQEEIRRLKSSDGGGRGAGKPESTKKPATD